MGFQLHTREIGAVVVVEIVGRLTLTDGHTQLRDLVHVSAANGTKKFILNLAGVDFIDSYGVGELVRSYSVVRQMGGEVKLGGVSQAVLGVLEITHLNNFFAIYSQEGAAVQAFERRA